MTTATMPFGKHKGTLIADVPPDYLEWVLDNCDPHGWLLDAINEVLGIDGETEPELPAEPFPTGDETRDKIRRMLWLVKLRCEQEHSVSDSPEYRLMCSLAAINGIWPKAKKTTIDAAISKYEQIIGPSPFRLTEDDPEVEETGTVGAHPTAPSPFIKRATGEPPPPLSLVPADKVGFVSFADLRQALADWLAYWQLDCRDQETEEVLKHAHRDLADRLGLD